MHFSTGFKTLLTAASLAALGALSTAPAIATPIAHDGSLFAASGGGVGFSYIHYSTGGGGGGVIGGNLLSGSAQIVGDIRYTWDTGGGPMGPGTTMTFDRGTTTVFDNGTYVLDLFTSPSILTVGAFNSAAHGAIGGVDVTHDIGGTIDFTLRQIAGGNAGAVLTDTFVFDAAMVMGPINGIGSAGGSPQSFNTYLWGDTGSIDSGTCSIGDCSNILSAFYASSGLGIDLAFSGAPVPEPAALVLFGIGLIGIGVARRRRGSSRDQG